MTADVTRAVTGWMFTELRDWHSPSIPRSAKIEAGPQCRFFRSYLPNLAVYMSLFTLKYVEHTLLAIFTQMSMEPIDPSSVRSPDLSEALYEELGAAIRGSVHPRNDAKCAQYTFTTLRN
jgi:hypothetical protein